MGGEVEKFPSRSGAGAFIFFFNIPSFVHFRQIRTAYQRCVQVAAPYEAWGHDTLRFSG